MIDNESGFSTPLAMTVIFSLSVIVMSLSLFVYASQRKIISYENKIEIRNSIDLLISEMEREIQGLKEIKCDTYDDHEIKNLLNCLTGYEYTVCDVSTGLKRKFLSDRILCDKAFDRYLSMHEEDTDVSYAWVNPQFADEKIIEGLQKEHKKENLFPLINSFPLMNIYRMNDDLVKAVIDFYRIEEAERKTSELRSLLGRECEIKDIARVLEIGEGHPFFDLVGTKTAFFEFSFEKDGYEVKAVFAAVPDVNDKKKISRYMLIDKTVMKKESII